MRSFFKAAVLVLPLFFFLAGCTHNWVWTEYPIDPARVALHEGFTEGQKVKITKGKTKTEKTQLLNAGGTQYYASEQLFTDAIADQLGKELRTRRLDIGDSAERSLEITVSAMDFDCGVFMCVAVLEFRVALGNGTTRSYRVRNGSPAGFDRVCDGAVALAVIEIMTDREILTYVKG